MAGIYIHIPFCKSRCIYCGFYSTTQMEQRQQYVDTLCQEWQLRRDEIADPIHTIYVGGGTPSLLTGDQLRQIFDHIIPAQGSSWHGMGASACNMACDREVTIECNPEDITVPFAAMLEPLPVNRISMGAQTFCDQRLRWLHRRHSAAQLPLAVERLRSAGFSNISIDLMYGFPGETLADWQHDIDQALALGVEHISAYCLMVEEGTQLFDQLHKREEALGDNAYEKTPEMPLTLCDEELERKMYEVLIDRLTAAGYEHYEISNFARRGFRSRHNSSYWHNVPYIGLGAAAHSYDGRCRSWNVSDIHRYMTAVNHGELPSEREVLDDDTRYNDTITVALRTSDGLDLTTLSPLHRSHCLREAARYLDDGLLRMDGNRLILTRKGLFVSDMVMAGLMLV